MLETCRNLTTIGYIWKDHNTEEHCHQSTRHERFERNYSEWKILSVYPQCVKVLAYDSQLQRNERTGARKKPCESNQGGKHFAQ
ncbi:Zinc finger protein 431, partial [Lemmus lemmus]